MTLRRRHVVGYVLLISFICLFVVFQSYDKYSRNKTITNENKQIIEKYLNEEDKRFLIDNNIDVNLFLPFIREDDFSLQNYEYYNIIYQNNKKLDRQEIVSKGNILVEQEFTLNSLNNIFENELYTLDQLISLATIDSEHFPESKAEFYPNDLLALSNENFFILDFKPNDLVLINTEFTLNDKKIYLRKEANNQLNLMCENIKLLTDEQCGNLEIQYGFLSYQNIADNQDKLGSFNQPGHSDFQLGNTISFYKSSKFDENYLYLWLLDNSYKYGFVQRFPDNKTSITGVAGQYGVFRYVGVENATKLVKENKVIEEKRGE